MRELVRKLVRGLMWGWVCECNCTDENHGIETRTT